MKFLILDDDIERHRAFADNFAKSKNLRGYSVITDYVKTSKECNRALQVRHHSYYDCLFLDHDLGGETYVSTKSEDCGMRVVDFLIDDKLILSHLKRIYIHSFNYPAGMEMYRKLNDFVWQNKYFTKIQHVPGMFTPEMFERYFHP